jgi:N-acetylgalactosamine-N,N'-diacetylbacillosaminyl-diphospho-undecaprenol 4-alpha-N-acetylgalactosaminyltransferase
MKLPNKIYKIALIGYRLSAGGSDKVMANLSVFFESKGIEVHNIIVINEVSFPYAGKLVNLGLLKNEGNGFSNKFKRLIALRNYLRFHDFDFIIDFRFRTKVIQELIISRLIYNSKTIFTVHSFLIDHYMPSNSWLARLMYNHCYANVALVKQMEELIVNTHQLTNVVAIANPINIEEVNKRIDEKLTISFDYIIAIGQFENPIKQFEQLIVSYANSVLPEKKIHLLILGDGNKTPLEKVAKENKVTNFVHFLGYQENPFKYLKRARFLMLCSKNEGMPNVLLESLACHTPVVSFDCPSGPKEIVMDKENGLLIEDQNWQKLTEAMNEMITNAVLYQYCKQNGVTSIKPFLLEGIGQQWLDLMKINLD